MLLEYFGQYIKLTRNVSDSTVKHYITALNTINSLLKKYEFPISSVFEVFDIESLDAVQEYLKTNQEFLTKDEVGNRMYSVAFNHFYRFCCEDASFFDNDIARMDVVVEKPKKQSHSTDIYTRNKIIISQALDGAHHMCENNSAHVTFVAAATNKLYMEGHHLIPMKFQDQFDCSLDVYANVVCLCPICHRLLHYGMKKDKEYLSEELFEQRIYRLVVSGIDISKKEFLKLVI